MPPCGSAGVLTVWFREEAIAGWKASPRTTRGGQPLFSNMAIQTGLILRTVFGLALRQTEGLIGSIIHLLGIELAVPDHSTLGGRAPTVTLPKWTRRHAGPLQLIVDSTGLKLNGPGEWLVEKHGTTKRRSWHKLHIGLDAVSGEIVASTLTGRDIDDGSQVAALLDQVDGSVGVFMGDGAYDSADVYAAVEERHPDALVIVPPRAGAVASSQTSPPSVTDTFGTLPPGAVAVGRLPADTIDALWSRLRSAATSVSSATPFDLIPRRLDELKSRSPTMF